MLESNATPWITMLNSCCDANEVVIAAPYIKVSSLTHVLDCIAPSAKLICVSRWTPQDIASGATDVECCTLTRNRNGKFFLHKRLHAKYYRFDNRVLLGSANLTASGMNQFGNGNLEILCSAPPQFDAEQFEALLLNESFPVTDDEFALWNQINLTHSRLNRITETSNRNDVGTWIPTTRRPEYVWMAYDLRSEEIPSEEQRRLAEEETILLGIPPNLNESEFHNWLTLNLLSSQFVKDVVEELKQPPEIAWNTISKRWDISKQDAVQAIATTEFWATYYNLYS